MIIKLELPHACFEDAREMLSQRLKLIAEQLLDCEGDFNGNNFEVVWGD
jgi:hypothetical protein